MAAPQDGGHAVPVGCQRPARHQGVHGVGAVAGSASRRAQERPATVELDRCGQDPGGQGAGLAARGHHQGQHQNVEGQERRHGEPATKVPHLALGRHGRPMEAGAVTRLLHGNDQGSRILRGWKPNRGRPGDQAHPGLGHRPLALEDPLHAVHAGRARHALDVEQDLALRDRRPAHRGISTR